MKIIKKHFAIIDSTSSWSMRQAASLEKNVLSLVTADEQTKGRGRYGRSWISPYKQNLTATFSFLIDKSRRDAGNISQVMTLSVAHVLESLGLEPKLKWPNDILINNKKIAGILCESTSFNAKSSICLAVSVGLNINMPLEVSRHFNRPVTSIFIEKGEAVKIEVIKDMLLRRFSLDLSDFLIYGFDHFIQRYCAKLAHQPGSLIAFHSGGMLLEGTFVGITPQGALKLQLYDGSIKEFVSGEIS